MFFKFVKIMMSIGSKNTALKLKCPLILGTFK